MHNTEKENIVNTSKSPNDTLEACATIGDIRYSKKQINARLLRDTNGLLGHSLVRYQILAIKKQKEMINGFFYFRSIQALIWKSRSL